MSYVTGVLLFWFLDPAALLLIGTLISLAMLIPGWHRLAKGTLICTSCYACIALLWGPALLAHLESQTSRPAKLLHQPYGIVVLGGFIDTRPGDTRDTFEMNHAADRLHCFIQLANSYPQAQLLMTGGNAHILAQASTESALVKAWLDKHHSEIGKRMMYEDRSRNTAENASYSAALVDTARPWIIVTSAFHMQRARASFTQAGFTDLISFPCDYRGNPDTASVAARIEMWRIWLKELIGLYWYRLSGRAI